MTNNLTEEVSLTDKVLYLVRMDNEEKVIVEGKEQAMLVLDSLAQDECVKLQNDWVRVFRRDQADGMKVSISTQTQGVLVNGFVRTTKRLDCIPVPCAYLIKGRHEFKKDNYSDNNFKKELMQKVQMRRKFISGDDIDDIPCTPPNSPTYKKLTVNPETTKLLEAIYQNKKID